MNATTLLKGFIIWCHLPGMQNTSPLSSKFNLYIHFHLLSSVMTDMAKNYLPSNCSLHTVLH